MSLEAETTDRFDRVVLDLRLDSNESPVYGEQEASDCNGYFESVCYHPLFLFDGERNCLAAKLRPGNVHNADDWDELRGCSGEETATAAGCPRNGDNIVPLVHVDSGIAGP